MKKILVCQHVAHEVLGTLDPLIRSHGFRMRYANFGRFPELKPELKHYDALIVLGGPMNVDETERYPHLAFEMELIRQALACEMPTLGICLGAQLMAKALGAAVTRNPVREIGWYALKLHPQASGDPLFKFFQSPEWVFQWHGDTYALPPQASSFAYSEGCAQQAFRYGDKAYGLQFHLEVDAPMIERWLNLESNRHEFGNPETQGIPEQIRAATALRIPRLHELSRQVFDAWLELVGKPLRRCRTLSSR